MRLEEAVYLSTKPSLRSRGCITTAHTTSGEQQKTSIALVKQSHSTPRVRNASSDTTSPPNICGNLDDARVRVQQQQRQQQYYYMILQSIYFSKGVPTKKHQSGRAIYTRHAGYYASRSGGICAPHLTLRGAMPWRIVGLPPDRIVHNEAVLLSRHVLLVGPVVGVTAVGTSSPPVLSVCTV